MHFNSSNLSIVLWADSIAHVHFAPCNRCTVDQLFPTATSTQNTEDIKLKKISKLKVFSLKTPFEPNQFVSLTKTWQFSK